MKTIIAGSREGFSLADVKDAYIISGFFATEIVSGTARGVDKYGEEFAELNNIPIKPFPANWEGLGKRAGFVRNEQMAKYADAAIILWDGVSKGTKHMYDLSVKHNLKTFVYYGKGNNYFWYNDL